MDRQQFVNNLLEAIGFKDDWVRRKIWIDRPYIHVRLTAYWKDAPKTVAHGFSKVCRPDKWNEAEGIHICTMRAARKMADEVLNNAS